MVVTRFLLPERPDLPDFSVFHFNTKSELLPACQNLYTSCSECFFHICKSH